ncbi:MAG: monofunctional biosynthetic peptidoglycan transglycosylase [Caldimonas sp.]|jgi:monofunctional biosynthetic peptidoglycan transglycosylase|uniref:monofunctional biosynthetic peptidoglycan transglycosylase n=1 Tax=Caldimonas manganoxidans TaxID=196015 RepID=UPI0003781277|nr:monofunctional biosynthetic peptidoglycan transglycosylase [Caldimonas manganoxidans]GIX23088.1 MAG: monofunctional biosynthetic peptidoglycan transglycosylase [Caldimonas sp.]
MRRMLDWAWRLIALLLVCTLSLQLYFLARVALMRVIDPQSTTFQRSQAWRITLETGRLPWRQAWRAYDDISDHLKRAVIAAEDASFAEHDGVDWDAIERAWERNQQALERAERLARRRPEAAKPPVRIVGGSTITQQLAKNLFLSGERSLLRKGQEIVITYMLEHLLGKRRILEIYLNSVEWGEGVFGAEAAAQHYFGVPADRLTPWQAARLAVMLPAPRRYEQRPHSAYLQRRAQTILARMSAVTLP